MAVGRGRVAPALGVTRLAAFFATGNLVATLLRLVGGILTSRFVDPSVLGTFNGLGLVRGYAQLLQAGVANGLNRDLPLSLGQGNEERGLRLAATAQTWAIAVSALAGFGLVAAAARSSALGRPQLAVGWLSFIVPVIAILFGQFYLRILFVTHARFRQLALVNVGSAAVSVAAVALVFWFDFLGLCARGFLVSLVMLVLFWVWRPIRVRPAWRWPDFLRLLKTGVPIFGVGQLYALWPVLDSTLVLGLAGTEGLGLYAIANLAGPTAAMFTQALGQVVYPRMAEEYGRNGRILPQLRLVIPPTLLTVAFTAVIVLLGWFLLPLFVAILVPKYVDGAPAAQWAVIAVSVLALAPINNAFNVLQKQGRYALAMLAGMVAYIVALEWLVHKEVYLAAFPQAMLVGRSVFMAVCLAMLGQMAWRERRLGNSKP